MQSRAYISARPTNSATALTKTVETRDLSAAPWKVLTIALGLTLALGAELLQAAQAVLDDETALGAGLLYTTDAVPEAAPAGQADQLAALPVPVLDALIEETELGFTLPLTLPLLSHALHDAELEGATGMTVWVMTALGEGTVTVTVLPGAPQPVVQIAVVV